MLSCQIVQAGLELLIILPQPFRVLGLETCTTMPSWGRCVLSRSHLNSGFCFSLRFFSDFFSLKLIGFCKEHNHIPPSVASCIFLPWLIFAPNMTKELCAFSSHGLLTTALWRLPRSSCNSRKLMVLCGCIPNLTFCYCPHLLLPLSAPPSVPSRYPQIRAFAHAETSLNLKCSFARYWQGFLLTSFWFLPNHYLRFEAIFGPLLKQHAHTMRFPQNKA